MGLVLHITRLLRQEYLADREVVNLKGFCSVREEPVLLNLIKEITKHQAPLGLMKKTQLQMVIIVVPGLGLLVFDLDK